MTKLSASEILRKKKQAMADKSAGRKNTVSFPNGKSTWRILPGWRTDDETFFHEFGQSWIKDMDGTILAVVGDAAMTYGEDDPIRNLISQAIGGARTDAQREHYKEALAKPRVLFNVQALDHKELSEDEAHILEVSEFQLGQIIEQAEMAGIIDTFLDADKGFDLIVTKTGKGKLNTKYQFTFSREAREVPSSVLDSIHDLDAYVRSKFAEPERAKALNAMKALTTGQEVLGIEDKSAERGDNERPAWEEDGNIQDAEYDAVEEAKEDNVPNVKVENQVVSDEDLDGLFGDD